jgi:transposase-like protein
MGVLAEIKNRGVQDILIACMDGLTGFPEAVRSVYPDTRIQLCIVHMVRNSTKFISYKDLKKVCADLKAVYSANSEAAARDALEEFGKKWDDKYPMIYKSWDHHWDDLSEFLQKVLDLGFCEAQAGTDFDRRQLAAFSVLVN